ncbi:MAG: hypothetical protein NTW86_06475 [Candidatus Sumerlaeota bacterium]|nr:hypothetical protein [Candidatus Sumerlaeota bacterium]
MAERSIGVGVVGVRNIGVGHVKRCKSIDGMDVVAIADVDPERLRGVARDYAIPRAYAEAGQSVQL